MIVFVDTSAFIALLDEDDDRHQEAAETFRWLASTATMVTHNYVQVETVAVAKRRLGPSAVERLIDMLFPLLRTIWVDESLHTSAVALLRTEGSGSLVDQVSFIVMRHNAIDIAFAFDRDFQHQGFTFPTTPTVDLPQRRINEEVAEYRTSPSTDLVSVSEISARAGRPVNTVQSWRRRHHDFPAPVARLAAGPIWSWTTVASWISARSDRPTPHALERAAAGDERPGR